MTPEGWQRTTLGQAATLQRGFDLPVQERREGSVPVVASNGPVGTHDTAPVHGPGVVTGRSGTIGKVFFYEDDFWPLNTTLYVSDFHDNDPHFVAHFLRSLALERYVASTGVPSLNRNFVHPLSVLLPPLPEQKKIAAILSAVDEVIEATEAVIEQLQVVKRAMMAELLTRGLPGRHTKFKMTEIGEVPEGWDLCSIEALGPSGEAAVRTGPFGSSMKTKDFHTSGVPVLTIQSLGQGEVLVDGLFFVDEAKARELAEYKVRPNDLVFSRVADIGRCVAIHEREEGWLISSNLSRIRLDRAKADAEFLMYLLTTATSVLRQVEMVAGNAGRPVITSTTLKGLLLPMPPVEEQHAIAAVGRQIEPRLHSESATLVQLKDTKAALMSVLLTGEVRVKTESADAVVQPTGHPSSSTPGSSLGTLG